MRKKILLVSLLTLFIGCGEDKATQKIQSKETSNNAPKIEIVANSNAKEIKVVSKESNKSNESTFYKGMSNNIKREYDPNSQPANPDASVRIKPRTAIEANMNIRSPYEHIQVSMLVSKLSKEFIVKCSACHNDYANGIIGPSLLGKTSDEIFNKIVEFKSGKKRNVFMEKLIDRMDDKKIRQLADEIYQFNEKIKKLRGKDEK